MHVSIKPVLCKCISKMYICHVSHKVVHRKKSIPWAAVSQTAPFQGIQGQPLRVRHLLVLQCPRIQACTLSTSLRILLISKKINQPLKLEVERGKHGEKSSTLSSLHFNNQMSEDQVYSSCEHNGQTVPELLSAAEILEVLSEKKS